MSQGLPQNTEKISNTIVKELLQSVKRLQNGDISKIMNRMGLFYKYNYGVSIPQLRQMADKYEPNNEAAFILFNQEIREAKILSSILIENKKLSFEDARRIGVEIDNQEIVEQFSRNVFSQVPFLFELLESWIQGNKWNKILCFYSLGWLFKIQDEVNDNCLLWFKKQCFVEAESDDLLIQQAISFAMQSIGSKSDILKQEMTKMADRMMESEKKSVCRAAEDFKWLNAIY
ncbi:MAG: DNA alkylation repair protein [Salinivirgaceae bacterium]|nr:DNA alkylation repair protein [Salinivirgaceae bacterium]